MHVGNVTALILTITQYIDNAMLCAVIFL